MGRIFLMGLPGSGKTTQVDMLSEKLKIPVIKMGVILRQIAEEDSDLGERVKNMMAEGILVDDETVAEIIKRECKKLGKNFILEGYPRTKKQIELYDPEFDQVFYLEIPIETAQSRLVDRSRADDNAEAIKKRFEVQMKDLEFIKNHYKENLMVINASKSIDEVFEQVLNQVNKNGA